MIRKFRALLAWRKAAGAFLGNRNANVSVMLTLALPVLVGTLALAGEVGGWYYTQRSMQNAADAAALAASTNASGTFAAEAASVASQYGFTNGVANTTVATTNPSCPTGTPAGVTTCYRVAISKDVPIRLARLAGFTGSVAMGTGRGQTVQAVAISSSRVNAGFCIVALASGLAASTNAFLINGGSSFNLGGCDVHSNASAKCNGAGPWGITASSQVGASGPGACGTTTNLYTQSTIPDPFAALTTAANIPPLPGGCAGATTWTTSTKAIPVAGFCFNGDLTIAANNTVTLTSTAPGGVIYIYGGRNLLLGSGSQLLGPTGSGVTIVFTGTAGGTPGFITGTGTIDIGAPTSGTWSGVAVYQDNRMTTVSSRTYSGNSPTMNITGLVYAPYADITYSGAINHQTGGLSCLGMVARTVTVSGTGSIFANSTSQCYQAGLNLPAGPTQLFRQALVQ
jgi:Flp pilus assembly protein TadG